MVCLGNICRSPLAEGILQNKTKHLNIKVDSAGTAGYHVGNPPDIRSIKIANKYNIDITKQRARKFNTEDFVLFDKIYAMDTNNYHDLRSMTQNKEYKDKVKMILNEINPNLFESVPDPYYGGGNGFEIVYNMLDKACDEILKKIE
jgi:protein-tyrosine phosphatase